MNTSNILNLSDKSVPYPGFPERSVRRFAAVKVGGLIVLLVAAVLLNLTA